MEGSSRTGARTVGGRYRLLEPLGSGGMGTVWRAEDGVLGRQVAVKEIVFPHGLSDEERATLRERTRREARAAARLDHPSAVTVYDVVEQDGRPWLVLELVEARTLAEVVREDGPLSPQRTAAIGLAVLGALDAAHRQGIVHRDVKPSNVLLGRERVVLTDFGIATSAGDPSITSTGLLLGSPSYISPERAKGQPPGPASDLWALGATLFTAVEGRPPYDKGEPLPTLTAVVTGDQEPYVAAGPLIPVLDGLLDPDPATRLDAAAARQLLEQVVAAPAAATPVAQPSPAAERRAERTAALPVPPHDASPGPRRPAAAPVRPPGRRPRRRTGLMLAGLAALAALLLLAGAWFGLDTALNPRDDSAPPAATATPDAPDPVATAAPAPDAWQIWEGDAGWAAAVPPSYEPGDYRGDVQYKDDETGRTLRVSTGAPRPDPVADCQAAAADFARRYPSYSEIRIEPVDYRGYEAADWEFTYTDGGSDLHAVNRVFVADGVGYSLFFQTRAGDWPPAREDFEQIVSSFRLPEA